MIRQLSNSRRKSPGIRSNSGEQTLLDSLVSPFKNDQECIGKIDYFFTIFMTRLMLRLILSLQYRKAAYQTSLIEIIYYSKMKVSRLTTFHPYSRELTRAFCVCHARISRIFQNVCDEIKTNSNAPQERSRLYCNSCSLPFLSNFSNTHQKRIARMLCLKIYYTASLTGLY